MELIRGRVSDSDPALEMAASHALLRQASRGELESALRVFSPTGMVAFGRRDTNRSGFPRAAQAARAAGFEPVVRASGGRAVACTPAALVIDHVQREPGVFAGMEERFAEYGDLLAGVLIGLGVDARVGEVPGEYCPGAQSINARGTKKLIGTAQRVVKDAWLFSSVVILDDTAVLQPVLAQVYQALEVDFDPASVGSTADEGVPADVVEAAIIGAYDDRIGLTGPTSAAERIAGAGALVGDHRVPLD